MSLRLLLLLLLARTVGQFSFSLSMVVVVIVIIVVIVVVLANICLTLGTIACGAHSACKKRKNEGKRLVKQSRL